MSKVKIGDKEYEINHLKVKDIKEMDKARKEKKMEDSDYTTYIFWYSLKKFNNDFKLSVEELDELIDITEFERIQEQILEGTGLKEYFKVGVGKEQ